MYLFVCMDVIIVKYNIEPIEFSCTSACSERPHGSLLGLGEVKLKALDNLEVHSPEEIVFGVR